MPRSKSRGFTLVELLVVVAIILIVAAVTVPSIMNSLANMRLRSTATNVANLVQDLRFRAVRDNQPHTARSGVVNGASTVYINLGAAGVQQPTDPMVQLATGTSFNGGAPGFAAGQLDFPNAPSALPFAVSFNARGLPCTPAGPPPAQCPTAAGAGGAPTYFIYFLQDPRPFGAIGWAAITVSPSGKVKVWMWDGAQWR